MSSRDIRRKYAQNYLKDPAVLFEMANCIKPKEADSFLEIGPGRGALTNQINKLDISIICVDIDSSNIDFMIDKFQGPANFKFINQDILSFELPMIDSKLRIVGNLPYNISTQIMIKFIDDFEKNQLKSMELVDVPGQNRFKIEEKFLIFIQEQLDDSKISQFVDEVSKYDEFKTYVDRWIEENQ